MLPSPAIKATDLAAGDNKSDAARQRTDSDLIDEISRSVMAIPSGAIKWESGISKQPAVPLSNCIYVDARSDTIKTGLQTIPGLLNGQTARFVN